jgi:hypothetical protein
VGLWNIRHEYSRKITKLCCIRNLTLCLTPSPNTNINCRMHTHSSRRIPIKTNIWALIDPIQSGSKYFDDVISKSPCCFAFKSSPIISYYHPQERGGKISLSPVNLQGRAGGGRCCWSLPGGLVFIFTRRLIRGLGSSLFWTLTLFLGLWLCVWQVARKPFRICNEDGISCRGRLVGRRLLWGRSGKNLRSFKLNAWIDVRVIALCKSPDACIGSEHS